MNTENNCSNGINKTEDALRRACRSKCIIDHGLVEEIVRDGQYHFEVDPITNTLRSFSGHYPIFSSYIENKINDYVPGSNEMNEKNLSEEKYLAKLNEYAVAGDHKKYRELRAKYAVSR